MPVALVTNAREFAGPPAVTALLAAGFRVCVHDRSFVDHAARARYRDEHPETVIMSEQVPEALMDAVWKGAGSLNALISNDAFPAIHGCLVQASSVDLQRTLDHLVMFPFSLLRSAAQRWLDTDQTDEKGSPRVVMVTSNRTRLPLVGGAIPDMARAAQNALLRSVSVELAPHGIPVNAIAPNFLYSETYFPRAQFIESEKGRDFVAQNVPMQRLGRPEEIGELIRFLATMEARFMTGAIIDFSGGWPAAPARP